MQKQVYKLKYLFIIVTFMLLASCGFHLRGLNPNGDFASLKNDKIYINDNGFIKFKKILKSKLYGSTTLVDSPIKANYIINITSAQNSKQRTMTIGGSSAAAYNLKYTVSYNVSSNDDNKDKKEVISSKTLFAKQYWQTNATIELAASSEESKIYSNLKQQVASKLITQVITLINQKNDK